MDSGLGYASDQKDISLNINAEREDVTASNFLIRMCASLHHKFTNDQCSPQTM